MAERRIEPVLRRRAWWVSFTHPLRRRRVHLSTGTGDEAAARVTCAHLTIFLNAPQDFPLTDEARDRALAGYDAAAVRIWWGSLPEQPPARTAFAIQREMLAAASPEWRDLLAQWDAWAREIPVLRQRVELLEDELVQAKRAANQHVRVSLGQAARVFLSEFPAGHARRTVRETDRAVRGFCDWATAREPRILVGGVRGADVGLWLAGLKADRGGELSPITRKKYRAYVSVFLTWAYKRYDLQQNPMDKAPGVAGTGRAPENIVAVRRYEDLAGIVEALKPEPYWQAWVAFAMLAGPRWAEQANMKREDIVGRTVIIRSAKTGRQRSVPVERNVLAPILDAHLQGVASGYVFGSTVWPGTRVRTSTPVGRWSDSSTFLRAYRAALCRLGLHDRYWEWGPREWRHCAGSSMGHAGCSSLQISQWLGNSEGVARRHYIPPVSGERWPLAWGG